MKNQIHKLCTITLTLVLILSVFYSCVNSEEYKKIKEEFRDVEYTGDFESFDSIYAQIPDYREVSASISSMHTSFNGEILLPYQDAGLYSSTKVTAVAVGMYIADLGYVRHFERVQFCMDYLESIRVLTQKLAVGADEFNSVVPQVESNLNNRERLFEITDSLLNVGNILLSDSEKYGISALVLSGLWLETTYVGLMHGENLSESELAEKLEQHFEILIQINKLFDCLSDDSTIAELKNDFKEIEKNGPESQSLLNDIILIRDKFSQ